MKLDERIVARLDALIAKGAAVYATYERPPSMLRTAGQVDPAAFAEWRSQSLVLLRQALSDKHGYAVSFEEATARGFVNPRGVDEGLGVLRAAREDVADGHLFEVRSLIAAEVFTDFIEMAEYLLKEGYKDPAASLVGAVLEDGLRRIADKNNVDRAPKDMLNTLNDKLAKAGTYNALTKSKVDGWRQLRNAADHGRFGEYTADDVRTMVDGVGAFLAVQL